MRTNDEAWDNSKAIAKRLAAAAGDEPMNEMFMAISLLVAYALKKETASHKESRAELEKFRDGIDLTLKELWRH